MQEDMVLTSGGKGKFLIINDLSFFSYYSIFMYSYHYLFPRPYHSKVNYRPKRGNGKGTR